MHRLVSAGLFATVLSGALAAACGTDAVAVDACRQVEEARCRQAPGCGIALNQPVHQGSDIDACIRFYDVACLHGLAAASDPGATALGACVNAINSDCNTVLHPEQNAACSWLTPPAPVDAGTPPTDAPSDG